MNNPTIAITILVISIPILRFFYYWREVRFLKDMNKTYGSFFHEYSKLSRKSMHLLDPDHPAMKAISKLRRRKSHYLKLVKQSGFEDKGLVEHEAIGLQQYRVDHKLAELIDDTDPKYIPYIMQSFDNIIGYFEDRAWESFDPYYWIKAVLNLPKTILNFGIDIVRHAITGK